MGGSQIWIVWVGDRRAMEGWGGKDILDKENAEAKAGRLQATYSMEIMIFRWSLEPVGMEEGEAGEGELGTHCCLLY